MAFTDILGQYVDNRLQGIQNQYSNATDLLSGDTNAWSNRLGLMDDEEERKRKERERLAQEAADREVQTQTIKTYQDGSQEHTVKTQIPAAVSPEQLAQQQAQPAPEPAPQPAPQLSMAQREAQAIQQQQAAAQPQPVAPQPTVNVEVQQAKAAEPVARPVNPVEQAQQPLPQAGPGVQIAGPTQMPPPAAAPAPAPAAAPAAAPSVAAMGAQAQTAEEAHRQAVIDAHNETDPEKRRAMFAGILANPETSEGNKALANKYIAEDYLKQRNMREAEKKIEKATPTELARYMKEQNKEGSYVKAILFARLGLTDLAKREQELISPELKMDTATVGNEKFTVVRNPQGGIERAFDVSGKEANQEQLAKISAAALPTKAHLLPSTHGAPVINAQGETGLIMYDPQTNSSYVQVGSERRPTTGWTTLAQNPEAVYGAAGAKAQGTAAGEGFKPTPLPNRPGGGQENAVQIATRLGLPVISGARDQAKQQELYDESVRAGRTGFTKEGNPIAKPGTSKHENATAVDLDVAKMSPQQIQLAKDNGLISNIPGDKNHFELRPIAGTKGGTIAEQKKNLALAEAAEKERIQVAGKRSEGFNKHIDENITPEALNGDSIAQTRKQQFALFNRPGVDAGKIFGIANGAGSAPGDQRWTMFRDVLLGKVSEPADQIRQRAAALGLNPQEQAAVAEYAIANADINAKTLKSTAGPGSISDAEQKINQERNVDPTKVPMLGGYNAMAQSQFNGDLARYKGDWATSSKATNTAELEKDWRKEKAKVTELYTEMAKKRIDYIASMGNSSAAVKEGYRRFPIPEYDPATETWKKTKPLADILGK